jgi:hypothetical protein
MVTPALHILMMSDRLTPGSCYDGVPARHRSMKWGEMGPLLNTANQLNKKHLGASLRERHPCDHHHVRWRTQSIYFYNQVHLQYGQVCVPLATSGMLCTVMRVGEYTLDNLWL